MKLIGKRLTGSTVLAELFLRIGRARFFWEKSASITEQRDQRLDPMTFIDFFCSLVQLD
jgi:hypothetical protein